MKMSEEQYDELADLIAQTRDNLEQIMQFGQYDDFPVVNEESAQDEADLLTDAFNYFSDLDIVINEDGPPEEDAEPMIAADQDDGSLENALG